MPIHTFISILCFLLSVAALAALYGYFRFMSLQKEKDQLAQAIKSWGVVVKQEVIFGKYAPFYEKDFAKFIGNTVALQGFKALLEYKVGIRRDTIHQIPSEKIQDLQRALGEVKGLTDLLIEVKDMLENPEKYVPKDKEEEKTTWL